MSLRNRVASVATFVCLHLLNDVCYVPLLVFRNSSLLDLFICLFFPGALTTWKNRVLTAGWSKAIYFSSGPGGCRGDAAAAP